MEQSNEHNIYGPERHGRREHQANEDDESLIFVDLDQVRPNERALEDVIGDGIVEARAADTHIDSTTARAIARSVSLALGYETPALDEFAGTVGGDRQRVEAEYLDLYHRPSTPAIVQDWIDLLAQHLLERDYSGAMDARRDPLPNAAEIVDYLVPELIKVDGSNVLVHRSATHERGQADTLPAAITSFVTEHGIAARAYLGLRDVDAARPRLVERFNDEFVAAFSDPSDILPGLSGYSVWLEELDEWSAARGLAISPTLDREALELQVRDVYDIVEMEGRWYAFAR